MVYKIWCLHSWCGKKDRDFFLREMVRNNAETPELVFYLMKKFVSCPFLVRKTVQQYLYWFYDLLSNVISFFMEMLVESDIYFLCNAVPMARIWSQAHTHGKHHFVS
ncbi:hypothetical protein Droror1_Dr00020216 [Drosera rotundifolia]